MNVKQVIVMRNDLNMRKGKMIAQGAHAACAFMQRKLLLAADGVCAYSANEMELAWQRGLFTKVCVRADSEAELLRVYEEAKAAGLTVELITDAGKTEFNGVPTHTCLAVGPDLAEKIDAITGDLKLL